MSAVYCRYCGSESVTYLGIDTNDMYRVDLYACNECGIHFEVDADMAAQMKAEAERERRVGELIAKWFPSGSEGPTNADIVRAYEMVNAHEDDEDFQRWKDQRDEYLADEG